MTTYSRPVGVSIGKLTLCGSSLRSLSFSRVKYSICCANCCAEKGAETQEGPVVPCSVVSHHVMSPAVLGGLLRGLAEVIARRFLGLCPSGSSFWSGTWNGAGVSGRLGVGVFGRTDLSNWGSSLSDLCSGISSGMSSHFMHSWIIVMFDLTTLYDSSRSIMVSNVLLNCFALMFLIVGPASRILWRRFRNWFRRPTALSSIRPFCTFSKARGVRRIVSFDMSGLSYVISMRFRASTSVWMIFQSVEIQEHFPEMSISSAARVSLRSFRNVSAMFAWASWLSRLRSWKSSSKTASSSLSCSKLIRILSWNSRRVGRYHPSGALMCFLRNASRVDPPL